MSQDPDSEFSDLPTCQCGGKLVFEWDSTKDAFDCWLHCLVCGAEYSTEFLGL